MPASSQQCNTQLLQQSLDDALSEQQEERLAAHLNTCANCREELERLAAAGQHWSRIQAALQTETSTPPLADAVADEGSSPLADFAVNFLTPSDNAAALGRLNNIEIRSIIGRGGNGIVLKGYQEELNRLVAVKVMAPQLAASAAARRRFSREAQATAAIVHPNVMPILTVHSSGPLPYLVMPYVDCESLQERLDRDAALPPLDVLRIAHQVANGLAAAHAQGLVHRDVKPANILLEKGVDRVMLTDFGLARAVDDATLTRTGLIAGTPQYMSPEQARGEGVGTASDLFSLGSVMYAMCTGRPPFRAETSYGILRRVTDDQPRAIRELNSEIPAWLESVVFKLLAKSVPDRFDDAATLAAALQECVAHLQQTNANPLPPEVKRLASLKGRGGRRWNSARNPIHTFVVLLLALPLIVAGFGVLNNGLARKPQPAESESKTTGAAEKAVEDSQRPDTNDAWDAGLDEELQELSADMEELRHSLNTEQ